MVSLYFFCDGRDVGNGAEEGDRGVGAGLSDPQSVIKKNLFFINNLYKLWNRRSKPTIEDVDCSFKNGGMRLWPFKHCSP